MFWRFYVWKIAINLADRLSGASRPNTACEIWNLPAYRSAGLGRYVKFLYQRLQVAPNFCPCERTDLHVNGPWHMNK